MKRGQVAMEYIIMVTLSLSILIGGIYFLRNYVLESSDAVIEQRVFDIANTVLQKSRKMYYFGAPSKSTASVEMPPQIEEMFVLYDEDEYYLGFYISSTRGGSDYLFESDVPIFPAESETCTEMEICRDRNCVCFPDRYFSKGVKKITATSSTCDMGPCTEIGLE